MSIEPRRAFPSRLDFFSRATGFIAITVGLLVLAGWFFDNDPFIRLFPNFVAMNPMTALLFIFSGVSLNFQVPRDKSKNHSLLKFGRLLAGLVLLFGFIKSLSFFGWEVGIDAVLFKEKVQSFQPQPNYMAPNTALNFIFLGVALLSLDITTRRGRRPSEFLALLIALISLLALIGYGYRVRWLYGVHAFIPMALHSAVIFHLLALGILAARANLGIMGIVTSDTTGGALARKLFPASMLVLIVLGWFRLEGERRGYYGPELGVTIYTVGSIAILAGLILLSARSLHALDLQRKSSEVALLEARDQLEARVQERTAQLAATELKFRTLVESSLVGIYIIQENRLVYVNPRMTEILGYTLEEMTSRPLVDFIFEEDRALVTDNIRKRIEGTVPRIRYNLRMIRKDNALIHVEAYGSRSEFNSQPAILGTLIDVTETKVAEEKIKSLNLELEQRVSQRTAQLELANQELESFSYSVSHDLRSPLRHIHGYVDMLTRSTQGQLAEKPLRYLKTITDASKEMGMLIDDLLAFSKMGRLEMREKTVNLNQLVAEVMSGLEMSTKGRNIVWKVASLPEVCADAAMLKQVFVNLIGNAVKYSRHRDPAEIEIGTEGIEEGHVILFVRDNGAGFDMRYADKLFGVFQRLHRADEFEGTGIGLATVRRIILRHGGRVWAVGTLNKGATFYVTLKLPGS